MSAAVVVAAAFEWPVAPVAMGDGFGSWRNGFMRGAGVSAAAGTIVSPDDGEVVFATESDTLPGGFPVPGGSLLAIAHESALMTIFTGLETGSAATYLRQVKAGEAIGRAARAEEETTVFHTFDRQERRFVNPLAVMPFIADRDFPSVRSMNLSRDGVETPIDKARNVPQGSYEVFIDAMDMNGSVRSAPYEIRLILDGSERSRYVYDAAWAQDGKPFLFAESAVVEYDYYVRDGRVRFGPFVFTRGRVTLSVRVTDFAGNTREYNHAIVVQ